MSIDRNLVAEAVTITALCMAAWMMVVQPLIKDLRRLEQAKPVTAGALSADFTTWPASKQSIAELRKRAAEIESHSGLARDTSRLYGMVNDLANTNSVQMQSMQPLPVPTGKNHDGPQFTRVEINVIGSYQNVANFVDAVVNMPAFVMPRALHLGPMQDSQGQPLVSARFSYEVLMFSVPPVLASSSGGPDAPR